MTPSPKMDDRLLPCPFCGEQPKESYGENSQEHWVACESDSCEVCPTTSGSSNIATARGDWNRRALRQDSSGGVGEPFCWAVQNDQGYFVGAYTRLDTAEIVKNRGTHGEQVIPLYAAPQESRSEVLEEALEKAAEMIAGEFCSHREPEQTKGGYGDELVNTASAVKPESVGGPPMPTAVAAHPSVVSFENWWSTEHETLGMSTAIKFAAWNGWLARADLLNAAAQMPDDMADRETFLGTTRVTTSVTAASEPSVDYARGLDDGLTVEQNSVGFLVKTEGGKEVFLSNERVRSFKIKPAKGEL